MNNKLNKLEKLSKQLKPPETLGGVFLPKDSKKQFKFMFIGEMPSMNEPKNWDGKSNYNFDVGKRCDLLKATMVKRGVGGSYATDIVKKRDIPRRLKEAEILHWRPFLLKEIEIIRPKAIIVLGRRTYEASFKPFIGPKISKKIKVDYVFHYGSQVPKKKFERRFMEVVEKLSI